MSASSRSGSPTPSLARLAPRPTVYSNLRRDSSSRFDPLVDEPGSSQEVPIHAHVDGTCSPYTYSPGTSSPFTYSPRTSSYSPSLFPPSPATSSFVLVTPANFSASRSTSPQRPPNEGTPPPPYIEDPASVRPPVVPQPIQLPRPRPPRPPPPRPPAQPVPNTDELLEMSEPKIFTGDGADENPQDFLKSMKRMFMIKGSFSDATKIAFFELSLKSGSEAETWFKGLQQADTATWTAFEAAFKLKWPEKVITPKTASERRALLEGTRLEEKDLGKRIMVGGVEEYSHISWADKVEKYAEEIPDTGNLLVESTRVKLPKVIRKLIGNKEMTWSEFATAVRSLKVSEITAQMEEEKETAQLHRQLRAALNPATPTPNTLEAAFQNLRLTQPLAQTQLAGLQPPRAPMQGPTAARPRYQAWTPRTDGERLIDVRAKALPIHSDTPAGKVEYDAQIATWTSLHPGLKPNEFRPYPLTPGSAPVASGECWACGQPYHRPTDCSKPPAPELEQMWRRIAGGIESRVRRGASGVNLVGTAPTQAIAASFPTVQDYQTVINENAILWDMFQRQNAGQGNGEGLSN